MSTIPTNDTVINAYISSHYGLTDAVVRNSGIAANVFSALSLIMTLGFLGGTIWIYSYPNCRHILDRVSFRLLVVAMFFEFWYSFNFLLLYINDTIYRPGGSWGPGHCTAGVYFLVSSMHVVDLLVMFIAVNLFLTINMGINPLKLRLERWYIGISIAIGYIVPLPSAATQHFGWDYALGTCWINGKGRKRRVDYLIEGIYITPIITCFVSTVCVAIVLVVLFRQGRATSRALFGGQGGKQTIGDLSENGMISLDPLSYSNSTRSDTGTGTILTNPVSMVDSPDTDTTLFEEGNTATKEGNNFTQKRTKGGGSRLMDKTKNFVRGKGWKTTKQSPQSYFHSLSDKFLSIAVKIAWYPITLLFINAVMMVGDLVIAAQGGVASHKTVWLYVIYYVMYGGRGICIAGLAIIIDPSLRRGLKAAWRERQLKKNPNILPTTTQSINPETTLSPNSNRTPYSTAFDPMSSSVGQTDSIQAHNTGNGYRSRIDSDASFDFATALAYIPDPTSIQREKERGTEDPWKDTQTQIQLPTVEVDLSYLDQELDMTILNDSNANSNSNNGISTNSPPPPAPAPPPPVRPITVVSKGRPVTSNHQKTGRGILSRLPGNSGTTKPLELRPIDPEVERRKEEKIKREERVKEIKRRFEEVQRHL
ncbi:hypothetical protein V865_001920 [Kwoniella europaea PYCC6329]|uniref:G-protein coupled receptors family 2 profile 2 domain-containing protein n=1 Tax=Kwoniella europaea PYCC6329 TaxID=1423913 RepID=A0AAX4KCF2_9TREE